MDHLRGELEAARSAVTKAEARAARAEAEREALAPLINELRALVENANRPNRPDTRSGSSSIPLIVSLAGAVITGITVAYINNTLQKRREEPKARCNPAPAR
jgi:hypothetical protein